MPGFTSMEVGVNGTQRSSLNQKSGKKTALQSFIKNEVADNDDFLGNGDDDEDTYKPRPQLPTANVHLRSLADLMRDMDTGIIDVNPEYQREVVWTADRMTGLINSLMENFYIPPIILNKKTNSAPYGNKSQHKLVCVDGKQRLSSVLAFIKGMIPCHDHCGEKWWFCDAPGSRRKKILPEETQKLFLNKDFVSYLFEDLSPEQEEDLFARVQMGVQLSVAEKMRASTGPWQELARLFVEDFPIVYSLMKDRARAKDFQLTLSCYSQIVEVMHPTASNGVPILKTNYTALPKLLGNKGAVDDGIKSHLASIWNILKDLIEQDSDTFTNANKYLKGVQTFAPVEMVAVTVLISMYSGTRNNRLLLGDIKALRIALREHFVDLRLNASVWKFIWDFVEDLEAVRGAVDGSTVNRRAVQPPRPAPIRAAAAAPQSLTTPTGPVAQRGRPTARTNPPSVLPPQKPAAIKREVIPSTPPFDLRPPKRKRTEPCPESTPPAVIQHPNGTVTSPHLRNKSVFLGPQSSAPVPTRPLFPPMPTHAIPQPATQPQPPNIPTPATRIPSSMAAIPQRIRTPGQSPHQISSPIATDLFGMASLLQQPAAPANACENQTSYSMTNRQRNPGTQTSYNPDSPENTPLHVPSQVRQQRVSELNGYQAPMALMGSSAPSAPIPSLAPTPSVRFPSATSLSPLPLNATPSHQSSTGKAALAVGLGAFAPNHTERQWDGIVKSVSPMTLQAAPAAVPPVSTARSPASTTPPGQPESSRKPRRNVTRPTPAQCDGAIDLTSDTELEKERRDLLSSFKGRSAAPAPAVHSASLQRFPVVVQEVESEADEFPTWGNNPYAK